MYGRLIVDYQLIILNNGKPYCVIIYGGWMRGKRREKIFLFTILIPSFIPFLLSIFLVLVFPKLCLDCYAAGRSMMDIYDVAIIICVISTRT